ncbi:head GIN domain-containing protein [Larkinella soli]|uniref:head GIN domain-containing protein n=1 Tax=Larkinella soli TaxID=1770527 RepID=UPI000FFC6E7D|nr:head GIN domain-containing protein [Larkinella soli]
MKRFLFFVTFLFASAAVLTSCNREDVGPQQDGQRTFNLANFDRLEMGSGMNITVRQGNDFSIDAKGDQRNLEDLDVYVTNHTLVARYRNQRNRKYGTSFTITMPTLRGANFSGGSDSDVSGFQNLQELDIELSGGSDGDWQVQAARTNIRVSGGSDLNLNGSGTQLIAEISGGSNLRAFPFTAESADINASGASDAEITASRSLTAEASGASHIRYQGDPKNVNQKSSGASKIERK